MKFPVLCFFGVLVAAPALAQMAPFSVHTSATMLEHRSSFQMVQLEEDAAGGPALMALGGHDGTAVTATTEMGLENWDDVGPDVWEEAAPMLEARMDFTAHAMLGDVWVFGGFDGTYTLDATERFDVTAGAWSQGPAMSVPRTNHRSVRMNDGRILITGGFDGQGETATCEVFDPVGMTFTLGGAHERGPGVPHLDARGGRQVCGHRRVQCRRGIPVGVVRSLRPRDRHLDGD